MHFGPKRYVDPEPFANSLLLDHAIQQVGGNAAGTALVAVMLAILCCGLCYGHALVSAHILTAAVSRESSVAGVLTLIGFCAVCRMVRSSSSCC